MYIFRQILTWNYMNKSIEKICFYRQHAKHWLQKSYYTDLKDFHSLQMQGTFHKLLYAIYIPSNPNHFLNEATFEFALLQHKVSQSSMFVASTKKKRYFSLTTYLDLQSYGNDFVWIIAVTYSLHSSVQLSLWKLRTSITIVHIHWNSRGPSPTWGSLSPWQGAAQRVYLSFLYPKFT